MQFPELTKVATNFVQACQALGIGLLVCALCLIGLLVFTSFGSEQRQLYARAAATGVAIGFSLLMLAPAVASILQKIFPVVHP